MRLALLASLSASLLAAACADDGHDSATFATATDVQLRRAIDVARFQDAGLMFEVAGALFGGNQTGCPAVSTTGLVTTVTTDCTTDDGWTVSGKLVITNFGFEDGPARDPAQPSSIEAFDLRASRDTELQTMDGKVEARLDGPTEDSGFRISASIDVADRLLPSRLGYRPWAPTPVGMKPICSMVPSAPTTVSLSANSTNSSIVAGGTSGSNPAASNISLFQNKAYASVPHGRQRIKSVSYTHLTLPTSDLV